MPDATITSTASTFGTIAGTFAADQSTITGTITAITGTIDGSVGVPGPQGPAGSQGPQGPAGAPGAPGQGVAAGGSTGQVLQKLSATSYDTGWLTLPADYITSVTAPLAVTSGNLSVNLSAYLPLAGGYITGDIQSNNGSGYRTFDGLYGQVNISPANIQLLNGNVGGGTLTVEWDGITFADGKQTVKYPGASILTGYALESWVTAGFYPLSGNPSGFLTDAPSDGSQYARKNAAWDVVIPGDRYLTTSTTSNTVSNGNKTFTIGTGLSYTPTQNLTISYDASNHMHGEVLTYNSGTGVLTVDINHHTGSGTYAAWVVNVGGVTPATSVAWGAITGTLSAQTDLQNALDLKLAATTAASTYYPLVGNPSGFLTSVPPPTLTNLTSDISWDGSINTGRLLIAGVNDIGGGFTEARLNFTSGVPTQPATGDFWTNGTDFFYRESGSTKTIASQSYVSATYQTLAGMSSYLTTASAAATYFTIASAANKADLASPTFSGAPTLPTGTIATTQSPGNNTTALATTAFVQQEVPAASTTAAGKVELATNSESHAQTSSTVAATPSTLPFALCSGMLAHLDFMSATAVSGSGAVTYLPGFREMYLGSTAVGRSAFFLGGQSGTTYTVFGSNANEMRINFSKKIWVAGRASIGISSTYTGDSTNMALVTLGGYTTLTTGNMSSRGIGWRKAGGTSSVVELIVHNGTTFASVATTKTLAFREQFEYMIYSDGAGNVTLYIDGAQAATTSSGPTGSTADFGGIYREQVEQNSTATTRLSMHSYGGILYSER